MPKTKGQGQSPVNYHDYLQLSKVLQAQELESAKHGSPSHDEMLFIITHQTYELWFKQILHELDSVLNLFRSDFVPERELGVTVSRLLRIIQIQKVLIEQLNILETMTALDFLDFRNYLIPASGFQSVQFRALEIKLGLSLKNRKGIQENFFIERFSPEDRQYLLKLESEEGLLKLIENWLERIPFLIFKNFNFWQLYENAVEKMLIYDRDIIQQNTLVSEKEKNFQLKEWERTQESFRSLTDLSIHQQLVKEGQRKLSQKSFLAALFINLYREEPILQLPFRLLTCLVDIDEHLTTWRYRHSMMAHRMLGTKIGTGGSSGATYLKNATEMGKIFIDFYNLSTYLIPRKSLPTLPPELKEQLGFSFGHGG